MARIVRNRSRSESIQGTRYFFSNSSWQGDPSILKFTIARNSSCADRTGSPVVASPFVSDQRSGAVRWYGRYRNGVSSIELEKYPTIGAAGFSNVEVQPLSAPNGWILTAVARSNPSRPVVTPPELIQNLIELPKLLRNTWKVLRHPKTVFSPKGAANAYLGYKFGWKPMIEDILKVLDLQKEVNKRTSELNRLYTGKGLRRRLTFGKETIAKASYDSGPALSGANTYVKLHHSQTCVKESWATVRWKPTAPPPYHPSDERNTNNVRRIVLGLTPEGLMKGLWNVIPWTWLIGWVTNIGSYTLLHSNTVPAKWTEACFMSKSTVFTEASACEPVNCDDFGVTGMGQATRIIRTRIVGGTIALPGVNMPFLDMSRLSTLAALGVQRSRMFR